MRFGSIPLWRVILVAAVLFLDVRGLVAAAPSSQPDFPTPSQVAGLNDQQLYDLYQRIFERPGKDLNGHSGADRFPDLMRAIYQQVKSRGDYIFAKYTNGNLRLNDLSDPSLCFLLYVANVDYREHIDPPENPPVEQIAREAISRGGWLLNEGVIRYKLHDVSWMNLAQLKAAIQCFRLFSVMQDRMLSEIIHRGGPEYDAIVANELKEYQNDAAHAEEDAARADIQDEIRNRSFSNTGSRIEMLTALHRMQKKPDPLAVEISGPQKIEVTFPELPEFDAALFNQDPTDTLAFEFNGDGRDGRWRFEVRDSSGKILPERDRSGFGFGLGGGLGMWLELAPGAKEDFGSRLPVRNYIQVIPPGEYTLRILYHDSIEIADQKDIEGLIVFTSKPLTLKVKPLILRRDAALDKKVTQLLSGIDAKQKLEIVAGTYGPWAEKFVPPDSSQGKLLMIGLPALPALLDALNQPKLTPQQRAIVLASLYSVTGQNDPSEVPGVLGQYDSLDGPWDITGNGDGGYGNPGSGWDLDGKIDEPTQKEFAKKWDVWKNYIQFDKPAKQ